MLRALLYLRLTSFKNWTTSRARRLRQPKYLLGAIVGVAYFYVFFFRPLGDAGSATPPLAGAGFGDAADGLPLTSALGAVTLLFFAVGMWLVPTDRAHLGFSEAEIAFLFPAPVTRRSLIHFRLLSAQFRSLAGAIVMMLFSNRWTFLGGNALTHALGWWFVFSALNLHLHGARFTLTRLADIGLGIWRRRLLLLALLAALLAVTYARLSPASLAVFASDAPLDVPTLARAILDFTRTAPLAWLLWPFELVLGPFVAADTPGFLFALLPAAAVLTLHYLWVVHSAVAFEDASVEHAQKRAALVAHWRAGGSRIQSSTTKPRRPPFALAALGRPEIAFLWKNLLSTWPWFNARVWLACAVTLGAAGLWSRQQPFLQPVLPAICVAAVAFAVYALIIGPQFARQDLRRDLPLADILKTYPLPGWQIVLGQILTPVAILTGVLWLALLVIGFTLPPAATGTESLAATLSGAVGLAALIPPLAALQLLVPNAAALVFPGWFHSVTRAHGGGPEVVGQRMIFFFAQLVAMVLALLPAAAFGGSLFAIFLYLAGPASAVIAACFVTFIILLAEVAVAIWLLGQRFERLDLSAELRA